MPGDRLLVGPGPQGTGEHTIRCLNPPLKQLSPSPISGPESVTVRDPPFDPWKGGRSSIRSGEARSQVERHLFANYLCVTVFEWKQLPKRVWTPSHKATPLPTRLFGPSTKVPTARPIFEPWMGGLQVHPRRACSNELLDDLLMSFISRNEQRGASSVTQLGEALLGRDWTGPPQEKGRSIEGAPEIADPVRVCKQTAVSDWATGHPSVLGSAQLLAGAGRRRTLQVRSEEVHSQVKTLPSAW